MMEEGNALLLVKDALNDALIALSTQGKLVMYIAEDASTAEYAAFIGMIRFLLDDAGLHVSAFSTVDMGDVVAASMRAVARHVRAE